MGSEFGQIDSADMPRPANHFAKMHLSYDQADNKGLKFKHLEMFELALNRTEAAVKWLQNPTYKILVKDEEAKVVIYARGGCVFALNFHPANTHDGYKVTVPADAKVAPELCVALNSEDVRFGGKETMPKTPAKLSSSNLKVVLPPRAALVLVPATSMSVVSADKLLLSDCDEIISLLA